VTLSFDPQMHNDLIQHGDQVPQTLTECQGRQFAFQARDKALQDAFVQIVKIAIQNPEHVGLGEYNVTLYETANSVISRILETAYLPPGKLSLPSQALTLGQGYLLEKHPAVNVPNREK